MVDAWRVDRPIADITRATESIGAQQLQYRINADHWPKELLAMAAAFDRMLDRLQEAFDRLSQFSADLAHELRTPINNLMGEGQFRTVEGLEFLLQLDFSCCCLTHRHHANCPFDVVANFLEIEQRQWPVLLLSCEP